MRTIARLSLLLLLVASCNKTSKLEYGEPPQSEIRSITALKSLCTATSVVITEDISIRGHVTGNDHYGEFPRTLVVADATGGICVAIDHTDIGALFPFGYQVTINCNGLTLARYGGKILLGAAPDGQYGVTRIPNYEVDRYIRRTGQMLIPSATLLTFDQLTPAHIDTFVRFDHVHFASSGTWCDPDPEGGWLVTERLIADPAGRTLPVRTQGSCTYATEPVPIGTGSIYGIIDYFNGKYTLRVTNRRILFATSATPPRAYP